MYTLKPISSDAIPRALTKAERYRLLNEPRQAESICRDALAVDPANEPARVILLLALTDQFGHGGTQGPEQVMTIASALADPFTRAYYSGVVCERWADAQHEAGTPGHVVFDWIEQAMAWFERARPLAPAANDDAILRWNTCDRFLNAHPQVAQRAEDREVEASYAE